MRVLQSCKFILFILFLFIIMYVLCYPPHGLPFILLISLHVL
jgi:hypothetical protein